MRGNSLGKMISMISFGESHGSAMGVIIDGVPPNLKFSLTNLQEALDKRSPGRMLGISSRKEPDRVEILSGIYRDKTLGTPICALVKNQNQRPEDYNQLEKKLRPGHADETTLLKFGIRDHRGGGRSSGRETLARVIGGYFAGLILPELKVQASIIKLGPFQAKPPQKIFPLGDYKFAEPSLDKEIENYLLKLKEEGDSCGGIVSIRIEHTPAGLGEPCFDKLKAELAKALLSVGAVVGFSYGAGKEFVQMSGKEACSKRSHFSGIEGGISNGSPIQLEVIFKPPSTVGDLAKKGRHDPCIMPRACVVLESMSTFIIADHHLRQKAYAN